MIAKEEIENLRNDGIYNVHFNLDSSYKWGDGFRKSSLEDIGNTRFCVNYVLTKIGLKVGEEEKDESCASYVSNDFEEEIYAHPMCLSGRLKGDKVKELYKLLSERKNKEIFRTVSLNDLLVTEARNYSFCEIVNLLSKLTKYDFKTINKKECGFQVAMNYEFENIINKPFPLGGFVRSHYNRTLEIKRQFMVNYINERLRELN